MIALVLAGAVLAGLDVVERDGAGGLASQRVGLVAHAASVTLDGRRAVDVLRARGVRVVRLFAPEHGATGGAAAGEAVADAVDPATGLPVVSLYGAEKRRPALDDLRGLDALVVDLQDAGVRFYTYVSTLLLCLDAAAGAGVGLVVLDRPNPLGGDDVAGPLSERPEAFLSMAPGPLLHGLTLGEMARLANARRARPARVEVVAMQGWRRSLRWADTGRPWTPPSPNLASAEAALAYPAVALMEATNVSEGRGTPTPFLLFGAPWLDAVRLVDALRPAGYALVGERFVPAASTAAPSPKYVDEACRGVRVRVERPADVRPWTFGVTLLHALRRQPGFRWLRDGEALDALLGTPALRRGLDSGASAEDLLSAEVAGVAAFRRERAAILLYP